MFTHRQLDLQHQCWRSGNTRTTSVATVNSKQSPVSQANSSICCIGSWRRLCSEATLVPSIRVGTATAVGGMSGSGVETAGNAGILSGTLGNQPSDPTSGGGVIASDKDGSFGESSSSGA